MPTKSENMPEYDKTPENTDYWGILIDSLINR